jgi:hypothetical protein
MVLAEQCLAPVKQLLAELDSSSPPSPTIADACAQAGELLATLGRAAPARPLLVDTIPVLTEALRVFLAYPEAGVPTDADVDLPEHLPPYRRAAYQLLRGVANLSFDMDSVRCALLEQSGPAVLEQFLRQARSPLERRTGAGAVLNFCADSEAAQKACLQCGLGGLVADLLTRGEDLALPLALRAVQILLEQPTEWTKRESDCERLASALLPFAMSGLLDGAASTLEKTSSRSLTGEESDVSEEAEEVEDSVQGTARECLEIVARWPYAARVFVEQGTYAQILRACELLPHASKAAKFAWAVLASLSAIGMCTLPELLCFLSCLLCHVQMLAWRRHPPRSWPLW